MPEDTADRAQMLDLVLRSAIKSDRISEVLDVAAQGLAVVGALSLYLIDCSCSQWLISFFRHPHIMVWRCRLLNATLTV